MADLRTAVAAVEKELAFLSGRTKALDNVLVELTALSKVNGRGARRQFATASDRPRKRRRMTAAAKKAISVRMKKHWAEKKRAEK